MWVPSVPSTSVTALLLDVMDTLVHDPFYEEVLDFFQMELDELFAVKSKTAYLDFERGRIDEAEFARTYFLDGRPLDVEALKRRLAGGYRLLPGIESLLDELKAAGVPMIALSNYGPWWQLVEDATGLGQWMSWEAVSCRTGWRKPEAEAYLHAARLLDAKPDACVFVDDRGKNCKGAVAVGMKAIKFESGAQLRRDLAALGIVDG